MAPSGFQNTLWSGKISGWLKDGRVGQVPALMTQWPTPSFGTMPAMGSSTSLAEVLAKRRGVGKASTNWDELRTALADLENMTLHSPQSNVRIPTEIRFDRQRQSVSISFRPSGSEKITIQVVPGGFEITTHAGDRVVVAATSEVTTWLAEWLDPYGISFTGALGRRFEQELPAMSGRGRRDYQIIIV